MLASLVAGTAAAVLALTGIAPASAASSAPATLQQRDDSVVTADALPTVQIDSGYVWAQTMIGSTVYAVGSFSNARAPLAAPGTSLTPRSNVLAFDIRTGGLLPFAPQVNGVVRSVEASADGTRIYIGGSFSSVNGQARWNFAALDASTGQLVSGFTPSIGGSGVYGITVASDSVYVGGLFTQANGVARRNLAAFATTNGALRAWAPTTDLQVDAIIVDPGSANIIAAGRFSKVNDVTQRGLVALAPASGVIDSAWLAPRTVINGWNSGSDAGKAGVFSLATDAGGVYGTGWVYANASVGNLEGVFAAEAGTGAIRWIADCHGDHYGVFSTGETVYATSHTHQCDTVGLAPELNPRTYRYVEAFSATAEGTLPRTPSAGHLYADWSGSPSPAPYAWYPDFTVGTASGLGQAGLSITGDSEYIAVAGEFTSVNNQRFQGIVRFSTTPSTGAHQGPRVTSAAWGAPSVSSPSAGRVRATFTANWDPDDRDLTYQLIRSGTATPVDSRTVASSWWARGTVTLEDRGLAPGASATYSVRVVDGDGNAVTSPSANVVVTGGESSAYADAVLDDGATLYLPLGTLTTDWAGGGAPSIGSGVSTRTPGAVHGVTGQTASTFSGTTSGTVSSRTSTTPSSAFSVEAWFQTSTARGGRLIGFGSSSSGASSNYDRQVYMRDDGRLTFGVYPGEVRTVTSSSAYNDGAWHHVVATQGAQGMALFVDGTQVAQDAATLTAQQYSGYWRIGGDNLGGWPSEPSSQYFSGGIDDAAVYGTALTPQQVMGHYAAGAGLAVPTASFASTTDALTASFDASGSTAGSGATIASYSWSFGDGTSAGTGVTPTHAYQEAGNYAVTLTITDSRGIHGVVSGSVTVQAANVLPTASFTSAADGLTASTNALASTDPDGTLVSFEWAWGDGSPSTTGSTASHRYGSAGTYAVRLTVTDDRGGQAISGQQVVVTHADPTASFTAQVSTMTVAVDGSASGANDGATLELAWDWGDGTPTGSGATASHVYAAAGDRTIRLTVTDSLGAQATTTRDVTVSEIAYAARDDFARTQASGWGSADVGGVWTAMLGSATAASVTGGGGVIALAPGQTRTMALQSIQLADSDTTATVSIDRAPSTGTTYVGISARQSSATSYTVRAWIRPDGQVWLVAQRGSTVIATQSLGITAAAGEQLQLRVRVTGSSPTTIEAMAWRAAQPAPATWQLSVTDATAGLQGTGWIGLHAARGGTATTPVAVTFDALRVLDASGPPAVPNVAPVAAFEATASALHIDVDASGSSDSDGQVADRSWSWGDGTPDGSGATAGHDYTVAGAYAVTLTVTDDDGATATAQRQIVVTAPDPTENLAPTASFASVVDGLGVSVDASASADADGSIASLQWSWGDGTPSGVGVTATHAYASAATRTVTLTVTDDDGAAASTSAQVTTVAGQVAFAASDDFARTVASGWGSADAGGAWSMLSGTAAPASVADGVGVLTLPAGSTRNIVLVGTPLTDVSIVADVRLDQAPSTGSSYVGVLARATASDSYTVRAWLRDNGTVWLVVQRGSTVLRSTVVPGITWAAGDTFTIEVQVTGSTSTTVSARLWRQGTTAPTAWQVTATDAAGLATAGAVGVHANRAGSATTPGRFTIDAFHVTALG